MDDAEENNTVYDTVWYGMMLYIPTGDVVVEYRTVDLYWGRSSRIWCSRSLPGTEWYCMSL